VNPNLTFEDRSGIREFWKFYEPRRMSIAATVQALAVNVELLPIDRGVDVRAAAHALARLRREAFRFGGIDVGRLDRAGLEVRFDQRSDFGSRSTTSAPATAGSRASPSLIRRSSSSTWRSFATSIAAR
jgi:hypothetical protein